MQVLTIAFLSYRYVYMLALFSNSSSFHSLIVTFSLDIVKYFHLPSFATLVTNFKYSVCYVINISYSYKLSL